ncbi:MAG TPA: sugar ABC transporter permease [Thermoanaerobaculia bacterium]|nr:sugar ABC transporter permease [Thermoanaerobaculia bacterium]
MKRALGRQSWLGPAMLLPAILYVLALVGVPFLMAFVYAVGDVKVGSTGYHFVGLANFSSVLENPGFRRALRNSIVFTLCSQALVLVFGNILAIVLKDAFRGRRFIRFLVILPWVGPVSIGSIGWKWILDSLYSVIIWVLIRLHLVPALSPPMWLGEPTLAMISVILVHTWHVLPFATVILLAGWTAIPRDIPEACAVDGAGYFRTLFQVTLPMLLPIINVALLFGTVFTFTDMTVIYILTRGGPYDTTQVLPSLAFFTGILGSDLAEGAAISIFLLPLLVLVAWRMLRTAHQAEAG